MDHRFDLSLTRRSLTAAAAALMVALGARKRISTGSALLLGMFAFGSTQAAACDWACWWGWGWCRGYGYYAAPAPAYYAPPAYSYAPAPAYYDPSAYAYSEPAPAYSYAPAPAYYPGPDYAADAPPPVSHSPAPYYAAAYRGYAPSSYRRPTQLVDGGKWDQGASMLGGPRKTLVATPAGQGGKATVASHSRAQNKPSAANSTSAVSPPTTKNGRLAKGGPIAPRTRPGNVANFAPVRLALPPQKPTPSRPDFVDLSASRMYPATISKGRMQSE